MRLFDFRIVFADDTANISRMKIALEALQMLYREVDGRNEIELSADDRTYRFALNKAGSVHVLTELPIRS